MVSVEIRILGPVEVVRDEDVVCITRAKPRALLALLALNAPRIVSLDAIVEALWPIDATKDPANAVQAHVAALRRAIDPERTMIRTQDPGYVLAIDDEAVDTNRFEALTATAVRSAAAGKSKEAVTALDEALGMWRGPALADVEEPFARRAALRLEEMRLAAVERRFEALLELRRHNEVLAELDSVVQAEPGRERLRALLMLALYRSGRQRDALRSYEEHRRNLAEEAGLEPSTELRDLEGRILNHDPTLDGRHAVEVVDPRPVALRRLVGRADEIAAAAAMLDDVAGGSFGSIVISGEPGIGKTSLAEHVAAEATERGAVVAWGHCLRGVEAPAFWPWTQILGRLSEAGDLIIRPELAPLVGDTAVDYVAGYAPAHVRFRMFEALRQSLEDAAAKRLLVLVIDDLQWADLASLAALEHVIQQGSKRGLALVGTVRSTELASPPELQATLAAIARSRGSRRFELDGLSVPAVGELLAATGADAADAATLVAKTGGNPFFVHELARSLGRGRRSDRLPSSVREVVLDRVSALPAPARAVLDVATVAGREFDAAVIAAAVDDGAHTDAVLDDLDRAAAAGLVRASSAPGRYRFEHDIMRDAILETIPPGRRARLHLALANAIRAQGASTADELAAHLLAAAPLGSAGAAAAAALDAARLAMQRLAYEDAAGMCRRGLAVTPASDVPETLRSDLAAVLGEALFSLGDYAGAADALYNAAEAARAVGDGFRLAAAALAFKWDSQYGTVDTRRADLIEEALAAAPPTQPAIRARLLARLDSELRFATESFNREATRSAEALAMARDLGDPDTLAFVLFHRYLALIGPDSRLERTAIARELIALDSTPAASAETAEAYGFIAMCSLEGGDIDAFDEAIGAYWRKVEERGIAVHAWRAKVWEAGRALMRGDLPSGERWSAEALEMGMKFNDANVIGTYAQQLFVLRWEQDRLAELQEPADRMVAEYDSIAAFKAFAAVVAAGAGDIDAARRGLTAVHTDAERPPHVARNANWIVTLCLLVLAAAEVGDAARARTLHDELLAYASRPVIVGPMSAIAGVTDTYLGLAAATSADHDNAIVHFLNAEPILRRMGAHPWRARTQLYLASSLRHRAGPGDEEAAACLVADAMATADRFGLANVGRLACPTSSGGRGRETSS